MHRAGNLVALTEFWVCCPFSVRDTSIQDAPLDMFCPSDSWSGRSLCSAPHFQNSFLSRFIVGRSLCVADVRLSSCGDGVRVNVRVFRLGGVDVSVGDLGD